MRIVHGRGVAAPYNKGCHPSSRPGDQNVVTTSTDRTKFDIRETPFGLFIPSSSHIHIHMITYAPTSFLRPNVIRDPPPRRSPSLIVSSCLTSCIQSLSITEKRLVYPRDLRSSPTGLPHAYTRCVSVVQRGPTQRYEPGLRMPGWFSSRGGILSVWSKSDCGRWTDY